jgi:hypothetical protein
MTMFQIETQIGDDWEPGLWETVDDDFVASSREPVTFEHRHQALAALEDHFALLRAHGMTADPDDWRVAEVAPEEGDATAI